jgi:hypothetical protein
MHADDVQPTWDFIKSRGKRSTDVTHDDGQWFMEIKGVNGWRASITATNFNFDSQDPETYPLTEHTYAYLDFYPPNGGNIRFDVCVYAKQYPLVLQDIAQMLLKHGGAGKNRVGYFLSDSPPAGKIKADPALWDWFCFWR